MSNFGVRDLRVVNPYEVAFREARSAVGAIPILKSAKEYANVAEAVADCAMVVGTTAAQNRELNHPMHVLPEATGLIHKGLGSGMVALLFGSEKRGLSNADLSHCHWLMHIPTSEAHLSMNLGQAVAVCLYELVRNAEAGPAAEEAPAKAADLELITITLIESLQLSGYLKPRAGAAIEEKIRRLVRRLALTQPDAEILVGMLRQVIWKMRNPGNDSNH